MSRSLSGARPQRLVQTEGVRAGPRHADSGRPPIRSSKPAGRSSPPLGGSIPSPLRGAKCLHSSSFCELGRTRMMCRPSAFSWRHRPMRALATIATPIARAGPVKLRSTSQGSPHDADPRGSLGADFVLDGGYGHELCHRARSLKQRRGGPAARAPPAVGREDARCRAPHLGSPRERPQRLHLAARRRPALSARGRALPMLLGDVAIPRVRAPAAVRDRLTTVAAALGDPSGQTSPSPESSGGSARGPSG